MTISITSGNVSAAIVEVPRASSAAVVFCLGSSHIDPAVVVAASRGDMSPFPLQSREVDSAVTALAVYERVVAKLKGTANLQMMNKVTNCCFNVIDGVFTVAITCMANKTSIRKVMRLVASALSGCGSAYGGYSTLIAAVHHTAESARGAKISPCKPDRDAFDAAISELIPAKLQFLVVSKIKANNDVWDSDVIAPVDAAYRPAGGSKSKSALRKFPVGSSNADQFVKIDVTGGVPLKLAYDYIRTRVPVLHAGGHLYINRRHEGKIARYADRDAIRDYTDKIKSKQDSAAFLVYSTALEALGTVSQLKAGASGGVPSFSIKL